MSTISGSCRRLTSHKVSQSLTVPRLDTDSDSDSNSYYHGRKNSFTSNSSTTEPRSVYSSSYDSSHPSSRSSFIAELEDTSDIALKSTSKLPNNTYEVQSAHYDQKHDLTGELVVGRVVDEAIAAIETSNRELRLRVKVAEESTRVLMEQNLDLYRKICQVTQQDCPDTSQIHRIDQKLRYTDSVLRSQPPMNTHELSEPRLKPSMSTCVRKTSNEFRDVRSAAHRRHESQPCVPTAMSTSFETALPEARAYMSATDYRQHDGRPSSEISPADIPHRKFSHSSMTNHDLFDHRHKRQISLAERSVGGSNTNYINPNSQPPSIKVAEVKPLSVKRQPLASIGFTTTTKTKTSSKSMPPSTSNQLRAVFQNPPKDISSPLHGTIEHHAVSFGGKSLSPASRPNMISLEEARRRAKSLPQIHGLQGEDLIETGYIIEGEPKPLWNGTTLQMPNEGEAVRVEKRKIRLQGNLLGLRRGSRDDR